MANESIEAYLRERNREAILIPVDSIDRRAVDAYLITIDGVGKVWVRAMRDSRAGQDFIAYETPNMAC